MLTIFKVFIEFVTILLLLFMFWFFGPEACGNSAPQPGIEPTPQALENKLITTGLCFLGAFQVASVVKKLPANAGDVRDEGSIPG